jgi:light-harvesting protein B-800-850 alpha chain
MNNAKMWLVVKPTVGVPLFLSAVAVGSFAVHVAVLSNTTWVSDFLSGKPLGSGAMATADAADRRTAKVAYVPGDRRRF